MFIKEKLVVLCSVSPKAIRKIKMLSTNRATQSWKEKQKKFSCKKWKVFHKEWKMEREICRARLHSFVLMMMWTSRFETRANVAFN